MNQFSQWFRKFIIYLYCRNGYTQNCLLCLYVFHVFHLSRYFILGNILRVLIILIEKLGVNLFEILFLKKNEHL